MRYVVEMRVPFVVDTEDLDELSQVRAGLRAECLLLGWQPAFLTAEEWRYRAQFEKPASFNMSRGRPDSEHMLIKRRQSMGKPPHE